MRILAVDDDDITLEVLAEALRRQGHDVITANDGREALARLRDESVRIVVCDWMMPKMDGLQFCRAVRKGCSEGYVYIILITGRDNPDSVVRGLSAGADDFITKPFEFAELAARITTGERILSLETRHLAIFALAKLAESRDPETGQHLERIREYTKVLAVSLANRGGFEETLTPSYVSTLYHTSPLHDIGKVGIPDSILLKPGRLSDEEFQAMKHHTTIGGETLGSVSRQYRNIDYLRIGAEIAMSHHERFNGKGYPMHLKGETIPLSARIVALTDVYDAVTSKRVYKDAFTHDVARNIVLEERGEHFDPRVVDAFSACESEFVRISEKFNDAARTHGASFSTGKRKSKEAADEVMAA
jgi:putative two-component system response regulator